MSLSNEKRTADILTPAQMLEHRVVFFSSKKDTVTLQTDKEISETRRAALEVLLGCRVLLRRVPDEDATDKTQLGIRDAFYQVLASCEMIPAWKPQEEQLRALVSHERSVFLKIDEQGTLVFLTDDDPSVKKKDRVAMFLGGHPVEFIFVGSDSEWFDSFYAIIEAANPALEAASSVSVDTSAETAAPRRLPNRRKALQFRDAG